MEAKNELAVLTPLDTSTLSRLVVNGDLSQLSEKELLGYYMYRCKAAGLDPSTKPFEVLQLNGKKVLYASKECSAQLSDVRKLSVSIVTDGVVGSVYRAVAKAVSPDGRCTDDIGCVSVEGLKGDALCNAMMKAATKAKRRAILTHAGLGMLDETEVETIPGARREPINIDAHPPHTEEPVTPKENPFANEEYYMAQYETAVAARGMTAEDQNLIIKKVCQSKRVGDMMELKADDREAFIAAILSGKMDKFKISKAADLVGAGK